MQFDFQYLFELLEEKNFDEIFKYIGKYIPQKIYKYYPLFDETESDAANDENSKRLKTLSENKLWLSEFSKFNDIFETKNLYTDIDKLKQNGYDDKDIEQIRFIQSLIEKSYKATSFSGHLKDCMPMWAHYANNYKGFCVEYEVINAKSVFPVFYESARNKSTIYARILHSICQCESNPTKANQDNALQEAMLLQLSYCIKHKSWEYENEYRILLPELNNSILCNDLGLKPIKIYAGLKTSAEHTHKLQEISSKLNLGAVAKCSVSESQYELKFE